jgi:hypothetical protein
MAEVRENRGMWVRLSVVVQIANYKLLLITYYKLQATKDLGSKPLRPDAGCRSFWLVLVRIWDLGWPPCPRWSPAVTRHSH